MSININVREFEVLDTELNQAIVYLRNCRTDLRNVDLFQYIDQAINLGNNYAKMIDGFKELANNNVDILRYKILIDKNCGLVKGYIAEINRVKAIAVS